MTLLTLNTHHPQGFLDSSCRGKGLREFGGIVECAATEVADFIDFIEKKGWLNRVNIVVMGDHLAMRNPYYDKLSGYFERHGTRNVFNLFVGKDLPPKNTDHVVHFDLFPTFLHAAGYRAEGGRLGLGYDALGAEQPLPPSDRFNRLNDLPNSSRSYEALW